MAEQVLKALLDHYHGFTARLDTGRPQPWLPISTTESLPGYRITESRGVVFTHDLGNPVYQEALAHHNRLNLEAPSDADYDFIYACMLSDLCKKAERINGNALVGLRLQPCRTMARYMGARNPDNLINPIHDYQTVAYATVVLAEPMPRPFVGWKNAPRKGRFFFPHPAPTPPAAKPPRHGPLVLLHRLALSPGRLGSPTGHIPPHAFQPIPAPGRCCIFSLCPPAGLGSPTGRKTKKTDLLQSVFFVSWYM